MACSDEKPIRPFASDTLGTTVELHSWVGRKSLDASLDFVWRVHQEIADQPSSVLLDQDEQEDGKGEMATVREHALTI